MFQFPSGVTLQALGNIAKIYDQRGVAGSGREASVGAFDIVPLYVDSGHVNANNNNDGTDPQQPKATIAGAIASSLLTDYGIIYVSGSVSESVVTPDYATGPSYVQIIGVGPSPYSPSWDSGAAASPCLDMRAVGWRVSGFRFLAPTTSACIILRHTDTGANDIAIRSVIDNNLIDGQTTGRYGIETHGCYDVWIVNNVFQLFNNAVAGGAVPLLTGTTPLAIPYRNHVIGNMFWDSENGAIFPCNGSHVAENVFQPVGYAYAMTQVLNTSIVANPGDDNVVHSNICPGDYSIAGGYRPGAADVWVGQICDDVAEAEVGDNGWGYLRPT